MKPKVSILILTHNAPEYVKKTVYSITKHTRNVEYELIVVDNASEEPTRRLVQQLHEQGLIHKIRLLEYNSLFAKGNNIAASMASETATHFLLLNSDVEIRSRFWLTQLLLLHRKGISSYGIVRSLPVRVDGYCLLIDAPLFRTWQLDESLQWWWSVTKLQANILRSGLSVVGYEKHKRYIVHFGGKSGKDYAGAKGMDISHAEVLSWFGGHEIVTKKPSLLRRLRSLIARAPA
jgi:glycosyltransferase involved in cell wall biosynthesis